MRTSTTSVSGMPVGNRPVNVALSSLVAEVRTKSSADSIWILRAELGREAVAIKPSGFPVLKKKESAETEPAIMAMAAGTANLRKNTFMIDHLVVKDHGAKQQSTHRTQFLP